MQPRYDFDIAYSVGSACGCTVHLKNMCMRRTSGPFDWVLDDFEGNTNDILADFENYLNEEDLVYTEDWTPAEKQVEHWHYRNMRNNKLIIHDFAVGVPLHDAFPEVKERYERRIARFKQNLATKDVLLVYFSLTYPTRDEVALEQCRKVCEKYGRKIHFLLIEHDPECPKGVVHHKLLADNINRYTLYAKLDNGKEDDGIRGDVKAIRKILGQYSIDGSRARRRRWRLKRFFIKLVASVIPVKSLRHQFKAYLKKNM